MVFAIDPPRFDLLATVFDGFDLHQVQALIAQPPIERLYVPVFSGFSVMDEVELSASPKRPLLRHLRPELRAVIDRDRHRFANSLDRPVQGRDNVAADEQLIIYEIHTPTLVRTPRLRNGATMEAHVFATTHTHADLQAREAIPAIHALPVHLLDLSSRHDVDTPVA